jgi:cytochrome c-type biogenesis protein CcmH/NrfG
MRTIKNKTMKQAVGLLMTVVLTVNILSAQSVTDGIKYLNYYKNKSALQTMQKAYEANAKDVNTIYWYGQALLANDNIKGAKEAYQKALQEGINDPMIWIGMGHIELMEGGDINASKQKFEQAITATTETKGKNKNKPNPAILNAIGRANADGGSKIGDPNYAIDKLKQAGELDKLTAEIFVNMGILYQKLGGEMGGEAVKAYTEATLRDPKNADAFWHIGKIYASQGNKDMLEQYYNNAIAADPLYPNSYLGLFEYYQNKDISKAKEYLDKYIQNADKDCKTDFYYADYLFKAGKNQESLEKAKAMEAGECKTFPLLQILFAYNYDRLGDSIQAKTATENFFATAPIEKIESAHYELAIKVMSKFPGNEMKTATYLQKAIENDTTKANKLVYLKQGADMFGKSKIFTEQLKWLKNYNDLKVTLSEIDHYSITNAAYASKDYTATMQYAKSYISAFPDKPNGYAYNARAAKALDTTTNPGIALEALALQNDYYAKDTEKNKKGLIANYYYAMIYFADKQKDYEKAIEFCDKILVLIPGDAEMTNIRNTLSTRLTNKANPPAKQPTGNKGTN